MREEKAKKRELHPVREEGETETVEHLHHPKCEGGSILYSQTSLFYQLFSLVTISSLLHTHWGINAFLTKTFATKILIEAKLFLSTILTLLIL